MTPEALPVVLVLASGRGTRFVASGGQGSKLQALLAGRPVLQWTLAAVRASGLPWHVEGGGHAGMGDSIAAAVRATPGAPGWLVLPGDLPLLGPGTLRALAGAPSTLDVVVPVVNGQRGHPVRFSARCGPGLVRLQGPGGAAAVAHAHGPALWPVNDPGCTFDIDTVQDLERAEQWLATAAGRHWAGQLGGWDRG